MGGLGQICLTLSYRYAPASVVAPFEYASIIFALLIGYFIFSEVVSSQMLVGVSIVICAGVIIIWREASWELSDPKQTRLSPRCSSDLAKPSTDILAAKSVGDNARKEIFGGPVASLKNMDLTAYAPLLNHSAKRQNKCP